jgi:hypothetical protein
MHAHSIFWFSRSNALDLLEFAALALHPLVNCFHFGYQHGLPPETHISRLGNLFSRDGPRVAMPPKSLTLFRLLLHGERKLCSDARF